MTIPNIVHFIWFTGPKSRDFSLINYLAVRAAHEVQKPDAIYMHCNAQPLGNRHWEAIRPYVQFVVHEPATEIAGDPIEYPQHQADLKRLEILRDQGGVYLDTDMLLIKPLTPFMDAPCTMSVESYGEDGEPASLNAGLIIAKPKAKFIGEWLRALQTDFKPTTFASRSVLLPLEIWRR